MRTSEIIKWLVDKLAEDGDKEIANLSVSDTITNRGQPKRVIDWEYREDEDHSAGLGVLDA